MVNFYERCPFFYVLCSQPCTKKTVAKLQKANKSRLNLSSETLVFLQSVFWHICLPVSTNKLFWNSETRCPQGYSLSQNLQKNFSSCISEMWPWRLVHQHSEKVVLKDIRMRCLNTHWNASLGTAALRLFRSPQQLTYAGTFSSAPSHAWHDCALAEPPLCSRPTSRPTDNLVGRSNNDDLTG